MINRMGIVFFNPQLKNLPAAGKSFAASFDITIQWALRFFHIVALVHKNSLHVECTRDSRNISLIYVEVR